MQTELAPLHQELLIPGNRDAPAGSWAVQAAQFVFLHYPAPDVLDANVFFRTAARALEEYPVWVIAALCSPKSGIVARQKWPPRISELVSFCDSLVLAREFTERAAREQGHRRAAERKTEENRADDEAIEAAMRQLPNSLYLHRGPVPGLPSLAARYHWERALVRNNPISDLPAIVGILNSRPWLIDEATKAELAQRGTGWSAIEPTVCAERRQ